MTDTSKQVVNITESMRVVSRELTPVDMLHQAVSQGANIDVLSKLMDLSERWEKNQARKAFDAAVADAKAEIKPVVKNRAGHNSKYADMGAIADVVDPVLSKFGLSYRYRSSQDDRIGVTCILSHKFGHSEETTLYGPPDKTGSKNDIQAIGSTLSYLRRYSLEMVLGLSSTIDDDDGKAAGGDLVSEEQVELLMKLITEIGTIDLPKFLKYLKVERLEDLKAKDYQRAMDAAESKRAKK